jgi:isocitrate lyase
MTPAQRKRTPATDFAPPLIIPDGDTGYRGEHHIRILVKKFVESKIGAIHIEDQRSGCKVCGHQRQKVLVSTAEIISRLNTARLQCDIMQVPGVIVGRTDAHDATAIDSVDHERDHPFVYGATDPHAVPFKNVNLAVIRKFYREGLQRRVQRSSNRRPEYHRHRSRYRASQGDFRRQRVDQAIYRARAGSAWGLCPRRSGSDHGRLISDSVRGSVSPKFVATLCGCPFGGQARRPAPTSTRR